MTKEAKHPLSRPFQVTKVKQGGVAIRVEATDVERTAMADEFGLPAIRSLVADYKLTGRPERIRVVGEVRAEITQICVVSLESFDSQINEEVDLLFVDEDRRGAKTEHDVSEDVPEPIINGHINLGAVTLEFFALGLAPYPRKPGVSFDQIKNSVGISDDSAVPFDQFTSDKNEGSS